MFSKKWQVDLTSIKDELEIIDLSIPSLPYRPFALKRYPFVFYVYSSFLRSDHPLEGLSSHIYFTKSYEEVCNQLALKLQI